MANPMDIPPAETLEDANRQRDLWIGAAADAHRGMAYYAGIVDEVGSLLGPGARTQDDGNVLPEGEVLRAKVADAARARLAAPAAPSYFGVMAWRGEGSEYRCSVRMPDVPGLLALGRTPAEAADRAGRMAADWLTGMAARGAAVPGPTPHGAVLGEAGEGELVVLVALPTPWIN